MSDTGTGVPPGEPSRSENPGHGDTGDGAATGSTADSAPADPRGVHSLPAGVGGAQAPVGGGRGSPLGSRGSPVSREQESQIFGYMFQQAANETVAGVVRELGVEVIMHNGVTFVKSSDDLGKLAWESAREHFALDNQTNYFEVDGVGVLVYPHDMDGRQLVDRLSPALERVEFDDSTSSWREEPAIVAKWRSLPRPSDPLPTRLRDHQQNEPAQHRALEAYMEAAKWWQQRVGEETTDDERCALLRAAEFAHAALLAYAAVSEGRRKPKASWNGQLSHRR